MMQPGLYWGFPSPNHAKPDRIAAHAHSARSVIMPRGAPHHVLVLVVTTLRLLHGQQKKSSAIAHPDPLSLRRAVISAPLCDTANSCGTCGPPSQLALVTACGHTLPANDGSEMVSLLVSEPRNSATAHPPVIMSGTNAKPGHIHIMRVPSAQLGSCKGVEGLM